MHSRHGRCFEFAHLHPACLNLVPPQSAACYLPPAHCCRPQPPAASCCYLPPVACCCLPPVADHPTTTLPCKSDTGAGMSLLTCILRVLPPTSSNPDHPAPYKRDTGAVTSMLTCNLRGSPPYHINVDPPCQTEQTRSLFWARSPASFVSQPHITSLQASPPNQPAAY